MAAFRLHNRATRRLWLVLTLLLAGVFLWLAFRKVDWDEMLIIARQARPEYLILAAATLTVSFWLRGMRWGLLLNLGWSAPFLMFWGIAVGYLGNAYLPARVGEIFRAMLVGRHLNISRSYALATAVVERVIDVLALVTISLVMLSLLDGVPAWVLAAARTMAIVGLIATIGLLAVPRFQHLFERWLNLLPLPPHIRLRLTGLLEQFLLGLRSFQHPDRAIRFIIFTAGICVLEALVLVEAAWALNMQFSLPAALMLLTSLGLAAAVPSTPGAVGIYQFVAVTVLAPFGFSQAQALVYILGFQTVVYGTTTLWGVLGMWRLNVSMRALIQTPALAADSGPIEKAPS